MKVSGMVIPRARLAQRLAYDVVLRVLRQVDDGYDGRFHLIPSGRGMHASLSGRMLLGSAQPLVLVLTTILLGGGGGGAWRGGSRCPAFDISRGGSPEG
jgi:hypothetical protein